LNFLHLKENLNPLESIAHTSRIQNSHKTFFQPKLTVNQPNDIYEQEADAIADKVMKNDGCGLQSTVGGTDAFFNPTPIRPIMRKCAACEEEEVIQRKEDAEESEEMNPINSKQASTDSSDDVKPKPIQRKCAACQEEEEKMIQRKLNGDAGNLDEAITDVLNSSGNKLEEPIRQFMEERFGFDFEKVRIHSDASAQRSAHSLGALAYTHGHHIVFGSGQYQPETEAGKKLLAHELTHVLQQDEKNHPSISKKSEENEHLIIQRNRVFGPAVDGFQSVLSDATTLQGIFTDVRSHMTPNAYISWPHIIVFTQNGLDIFETSSGNIVAHYARRSTESMPNDGLWNMDDTGGVGKFGLRDGTPALEARAMEITGFSDERQNIIIERRGISFLDDFTMTTATELSSHNFLPALMMVRELPASGTGTGTGDGAGGTVQLASWAQSQVSSVQTLFTPAHPASGSSTGTPASERDMSQDQSTPDRLVPWPRSDGSQFVNVWVGGQDARDHGVSQALELREGESTEDLQSRIQEATRQLRQRLTQRAASSESTMTHGNDLYNPSTFTGGTTGQGPTANRPAYRADVTGPDIMVRGGTGTFNMHLHYEDEDPTLLGQVALAFGGSDYTWQIIDITALYRQVLDEQEERIVQQQRALRSGQPLPQPVGIGDAERRLHHRERSGGTTEDSVSRIDASLADATRTRDNFSEDIRQARADLLSPISSQDGSSESAIRSVLMNSFNLATSDLHAIMSAGGWLVRFFPAVFDANHDYEREVVFPNQDGFYLVRCVAQPRPGGDGSILRLPSYGTKIVEVKEIQARARDEISAQSQNLESTILELLLSFRMETNAENLRTIRAQLELKVQEAAQTNRPFLDTQIEQRQTALQSLPAPEEGVADPNQSRREKLNEEISILQQGTRASSGTLAMILTRQIQIKERELAAIPEWDRFRRRDAERQLETLRRRLSTATAREREMEAGGYAIVRPNAVFINEENGQTVPLLIEMVQMSGRSPRRGYNFRISDITGADGDNYEAIGGTKAIAVRNVITEYAGHFPYGRGYIVVRIPASANYGISDEIMVRCNPRDSAQASERLDELMQVLAILGLFVPGVGVAAAVAGAAVSAARILHRVSNNTFEPDMNFVMDMLNILSAVASGVTALGNARLIRAQRMFAIVEGDADMARWVTSLDRFSRVAQFTEDAFNEATYFLGMVETVNNYLEIQRQEIGGHLSHADARRQRAQLITQEFNNQFMQHAPGVIAGIREHGEHTRAHEERPPEHLPTDHEQPRPQEHLDHEERPSEERQEGGPAHEEGQTSHAAS
jgi:hypothetical protein